MHARLAPLLTLCLVMGAYSAAIVTPTDYTLVSTHGNSSLYTIDGAKYATAPPMLLDLHGSRSEQGEAYGALLGAAVRLGTLL